MTVTTAPPAPAPASAPPAATGALGELAARLAGAVALPGGPGYELAAPFNTTVLSTPCAVVAVRTPQDVAETVRWAARQGLRVAVRRTGHGAVPVDAGTLLVHTAGLDELAVDPGAGTARVGAGVVWQQLLDAATPHGLAPLCGSAPAVGVVGYLTGGGIGPLARTHGASSDHVRALEVVTGEGELLRASATEHEDLFWGLRGGKGTLGVVTAVELDLPRQPEVWAGSVWFDGADAPAVMEAWQQLCATLPEEGTTSVALVQLPPLPGVPPPLAGRHTLSVRFAWTGDPADGERHLAPVLAAAEPVLGGVGVIPYAAIGAVHGDPDAPLPVHERSALLRELPTDAVDALLAAAGSASGSVLTAVELRLLGGALAREPQHASAVCHRTAAYNLMVIGVLAPPVADVVPAHVDRVLAALAPWASGGVLPNFSASADPAEVARGYDEPTLHRLASLAERYDPAGVLCGGQVVRVPARQAG